MATFQAKSLSDEDIARQLDLCYNTELVLVREERGGVLIWRCPACHFELRTVRLTRQLEHPRAALVGAWSA